MGLKRTGSEELQVGKPISQVASIDRRKAICLDLGVSGDEEIGDKVLARPSCQAVAVEGQSREVGRSGIDGSIGNGEPAKEYTERWGIRGGGRKLGKCNRTNNKGAVRSCQNECLEPLLGAGLLFDDRPQDGGIEGGDHDGSVVVSAGPPRRSSMIVAVA